MTTIKQDTKSKDIKAEVRQLRKAAQKAMVSKKAARRFLLSTGVYTSTGRLKPAFR